MNVTEPLRARAARTPDAIAYMSARGAVATYAVLEWTVDAVARRLATVGLRGGDVAIVATGDLFRYLAIALAMGRIGVAHAPASLPAGMARAAIVDRPDQAPAGVRALGVTDVWPTPSTGAGEPVALHAGGDALLKLCPSSGTTGARKFIGVSHEVARRRMDVRLEHDAGRADHRGTAQARQACFIEPTTSYGFTSCLTVLQAGGAVLEPNLDAADIPGWVARSGVNTMILSPIALSKVVDVLPPVRRANAVDIVEVGGGALPAQVLAATRERLSPQVFMNYGSTECGRVAGAAASALAGIHGAVGYAYPGVELRVVDEAGHALPPGAEGELAIRSARSVASYYDDPAASARVFRDGWVYPGDRAVLRDDGLLVITGRTDDVINMDGVKFNPQVIEDAMMALGGLREVCVFALANDAGVTSLCAAIVPTRPTHADAFHEQCRRALGNHAPTFIMHMDALPRNSNGKVMRPELVRIARKASGMS